MSSKKNKDDIYQIENERDSEECKTVVHNSNSGASIQDGKNEETSSSQISDNEGLIGPIIVDNQKSENQEDNLLDNENSVDSKTISGDIEFTIVRNSMFNKSVSSLISTEEQ